MSAGESAYDVARRQRDKAARLERSAALWEQGAAGEVAVARVLGALPDGWVVLHDLAWPGRARANIDHVVIGPGGVFVVDAKNWTGTIEVRDQVLRQNSRAREDAVVSAAEAAIALQSLAPVGHLCTAVLCFVRDDPMTGWARDVMVCTTSNLVAMLTSRPTVLEPDTVGSCVRAIRGGTSSRSVAPPTAVVASRPRSTTRRRDTAPRASPRPRKRRTAWIRVVAALTFLALLVGGGLARPIEWGSRQLVEIVTPSPPVEPAPVKKKDRDGARKKERPARDADRGSS